MFKQVRQNSLVVEGVIQIVPWSRHTPVELPVILKELHRSSLKDIHGVPDGNGEPVVIIPGLWVGEEGVRHVKEWLQRRNYYAVVPNVDIDNSHPDITLARICDTMEQVHRDTGSKIKVMGTSLGGMFALVAARRKVRLVDRVFTFSTPVSMPIKVIRQAADKLEVTAQRIGTRPIKKFILEATHAAVDRNLKAIHFYGRKDGVIHQDTLVRGGLKIIEIEGARHSNLTSRSEALIHLAHALRGAGPEALLAA